jgi:hypothetical protein
MINLGHRKQNLFKRGKCASRNRMPTIPRPLTKMKYFYEKIINIKEARIL